MKKTRVAVDYGDRQIDIDVPGRVTIARFKEPRRLRNPAAAVKKALAEPYGSPPLADLIKPGMKVAVGFDDPTRPPAPWQVMLPVVVDALVKGGVRKKDILLICAGGAHRKYTPAELAAFVGPEIFNRFWPSGQLTCHDCHDPDQLTDLGVTRGGGVAVHNRRFVEADLMIYCGQVMAHNWGGYTGMGVVVGLAGTRSINSHHSHRVVDDPKSTTGDHVSMLYRRVKAEIQGQIEKATGKRIFYVNWVGGAKGRMAGVFAGYSPEVEPPAWKLADSFHRVKVPQADILVLGLPLKYAYGTVHDPLIATVGLTTPAPHLAGASRCSRKAASSSAWRLRRARSTRTPIHLIRRPSTSIPATTAFPISPTTKASSPTGPSICTSILTVMPTIRSTGSGCFTKATTCSSGPAP